jgi:hypothetical protein
MRGLWGALIGATDGNRACDVAVSCAYSTQKFTGRRGHFFFGHALEGLVIKSGGAVYRAVATQGPARR